MGNCTQWLELSLAFKGEVITEERRWTGMAVFDADETSLPQDAVKRVWGERQAST